MVARGLLEFEAGDFEGVGEVAGLRRGEANAVIKASRADRFIAIAQDVITF